MFRLSDTRNEATFGMTSKCVHSEKCKDQPTYSTAHGSRLTARDSRLTCRSSMVIVQIIVRGTGLQAVQESMIDHHDLIIAVRIFESLEQMDFVRRLCCTSLYIFASS
jgi:hypothetical protein